MPVLKRLSLLRIVADGLDDVVVPAGTIALRTAPDELLLVPTNLEGLRDLPGFSRNNIADPHAIIITDTGHSGVWLSKEEAYHLLSHTCEWPMPAERPAFAQGAIAGIATKLWLEEDRVLFVVPAPFAHDFASHIG